MERDIPAQSCDHCRRRKIRCDRLQPCSKCLRGSLQCTYHDYVKRKTPKTNALVDATQPLPTSPSSRETAESDRQDPQLLDTVSQTFASNQSSSTSRLSDQATPRRFVDVSAEAESHSRLSGPKRLSGQLLRVHARLFLKWMFPVFPVVRSDRLLSECDHVATLTVKGYCFLVAMAAATNIQLNLAPSSTIFDLMGTENATEGVENPYSHDYILSELIKTRSSLHIAESPDTDTLLTSAFMFSAYANLERHDAAWFYLSQTVSFVIALGLHDERNYNSLPIYDAHMGRRIFWMVFIHER